MFSILKVNTLLLGFKGSFTRIYGASADSADFKRAGHDSGASQLPLLEGGEINGIKEKENKK